MHPIPDSEKTSPQLPWLINLRWIAFTGQLITLLLAWTFLEITLYMPGLLGCLLINAAVNIWLISFKRRNGRDSQQVNFIVLGIDTLLLTAMLHWSGGAHNPFTAFYMLHIVVGAMILPRIWSYAMVFLAFACYLLLYISEPAMDAHAGHAGHQHAHSSPESGSISHELHFQGMIVGMVLTGICSVVFIHRLQNALANRDKMLAENQEKINRQERFASLAILAAGAAHELSTPLGTIALVSQELEEGNGSRTEQIEDIQLIRTEVKRCRTIIDRLNPENQIEDKTESIIIPTLLEKLRKELPEEQRVRLRIQDERSENSPLLCPPLGLRQSLCILIKNAHEATDDKSEICLKVYQDTTTLYFHVINEGFIDPAVQKRMGEPFFTTKELGKGLGLGLFLARMYVEKLQGRLEIQSSKHSKTEITLCLPLPS
jgi:two-component system sensor histidine kinase RegB